MQNNFEVSPASSTPGPSNVPPDSLSWRSALLGASVGIAGPAYFGTLFTNLTLWLFLSQGRSKQEAYSYISEYSLTFPLAAHLVADIFFAIACGWVSAAYGRGASFSQGLVAGLLSVSFPIIMYLSPNSGAPPPLFAAVSLLIPVLGSCLGAIAYARRT